MKHIQQPKDSFLCGQCCVAMITGKSLNDVISVIGNGKTNTKQVLEMLGSFAEATELKRNYHNNLSKRCILKVTWSDGRTHWVVKWDDKVHDPFLPIGHSYMDYIEMIYGNGRITSHLKLK